MFQSRQPVPTVDVAALPADVYLLDVRERDEWECGHAPGAVHLPLSELAARADEVPRGQEVFVVCKVGARSEQAVRYLNQFGCSTVNVAGGMLAWEAAGRPIAGGAAGHPFVA